MKRIPYKVRLYLSIGLFIWAIISFIIAIIYYVNTKQLWAMIVAPIISFISFIVSIVFFPRYKDDGTPTVEPKPKVNNKTKQYKPHKQKKPFINEKEWEELDEEDEEYMYIDEDD